METTNQRVDELRAHSLEVINKLKLLDLGAANLDYILQLVSEIQLPITQSEVIPKTVICRCRLGKGFKSWQEMTYKPIEYCKTTQRASLPNETVFYGVISDEWYDISSARAIGVSECSKLASEGVNSYGREQISVSQWHVKVPIKVACIMGEHLFDGVQNNKLLIDIKRNFVKQFKNDTYVNTIADFVASEFSKKVESGNNFLYSISAAITHTLLYTYGFEGVVYPSVKLGGQAGMNIALRPDVVSKKLRIGNIADQCYYKNNEHSYVDVEDIWDAYHKRYIIVGSDTPKDIIKEKIHLVDGELEDLPLIQL